MPISLVISRSNRKILAYQRHACKSCLQDEKRTRTSSSVIVRVGAAWSGVGTLAVALGTPSTFRSRYTHDKNRPLEPHEVHLIMDLFTPKSTGKFNWCLVSSHCFIGALSV